MYVPYITHAFFNISGISQLDISVTRNERVDRRGRKRAVDVMLYDSSSNIELDQGDTTTEKTNDPVERHNVGGDTAIDNVQGKDVKLLSDRSNISQDNDDDKCLREVTTCSKNMDSYDREQSLELCMTSLIFKNMDIELDCIDGDLSNDIKEIESFAPEGDAEQNTSTVIEVQALHYIGGYIVRKFSLKYPHLGCKCDDSESISKENSWTETVNRRNLYVPSEEFYSQLKIMRKIFKAIHGEVLREGKKLWENSNF
ncbi:hypothetical protein Pmani_000479 [Petrolisthes manimaculis]|uniref:Uncharacterized protein n=1 Tax=Petrolisthes manimaculis TaxID=1843537 RepID=A0AAE1QPU3_9EUCA|nr:hypothetical protein Pmani_000479 [Petrolisthes manimaculis]